MKPWHMVVGALAVGGGFAAIFASGGEASADDGEPWPNPVDDLKPGEETEMAKQVVCTCFRGGAKETKELVLCSLRQIWDGPPWKRILERSIEGDHASLQKRVAKIAGWAQKVISSDGAWCDDAPEDEDEPEPEEEEETPQEKRKRIFDSLVSEKYQGGHLRLVEKGDSGIERAAQWALWNAGADVGEPGKGVNNYQKLILPMMKAFSRGKKWNRRLFARASDGYWAVDGKAIGSAWNPTHEHARAAVLAGRFPSGNGSQYGLVWVPKFDVAEARDHATFVLLEEDPPQELLDLLEG